MVLKSRVHYRWILYTSSVPYKVARHTFPHENRYHVYAIILLRSRSINYYYCIAICTYNCIPISKKHRTYVLLCLPGSPHDSLPAAAVDAKRTNSNIYQMTGVFTLRRYSVLFFFFFHNNNNKTFKYYGTSSMRAGFFAHVYYRCVLFTKWNIIVGCCFYFFLFYCSNNLNKSSELVFTINV